MKSIIQSIKAFFLFTLILGICYPLFILLVLQLTVPLKANGSLVRKEGSVTGSKLIGQSFENPKYFQSRPSAVNYDGASSGASNLGPTNARLMERVAAEIAEQRKLNRLSKDAIIPADMALASASGLDPHITFENAFYQSKRIAAMRKVPKERVESLILQNTGSDFAGLWGEGCVNVFKLNLALDELKTDGARNKEKK